MISVRVTQEEYNFKEENGINWRYIVRRGIAAITKEHYENKIPLKQEVF